MKNYSIEQIISVMRKYGFAVFEGNSGNTYRDYDLNIVGVRNASRLSDSFDDLYIIFYRLDKKWQIHWFPATTDPGRESLTNPVFPEAVRAGTLIICHGMQYRSAYALGKHGSGSWRHTALVQKRPIAGYRDANRDVYLDMDPKTVQWGLWGANHHAASLSFVASRVSNWSAGCQVIQRPEDYYAAADLWQKAAKIWGPYFTYTLLHQNDFE